MSVWSPAGLIVAALAAAAVLAVGGLGAAFELSGYADPFCWLSSLTPWPSCS